jgi:hypothetical protein
VADDLSVDRLGVSYFLPDPPGPVQGVGPLRDDPFDALLVEQLVPALRHGRIVGGWHCLERWRHFGEDVQEQGPALRVGAAADVTKGWVLEDVPRGERGGPLLGKGAGARGRGSCPRLRCAEVHAAVLVDDRFPVEDRAGQQGVERGKREVHPRAGDVPAGPGLDAGGLGLPPEDRTVPVELDLVPPAGSYRKARHGLGERDIDRKLHVTTMIATA